MRALHAGLLSLVVVLGAGACERAREPTGAASADAVAVPLRYAKHLSIERRGPLTVLRLQAPARGADGAGQTAVVVLSPRDGPAPVLSGDLADAMVVRTPVRRIAVNIGAEEGMLNAINAADRLVAVGGTFSYDDAIRSRTARGELGQLGYGWHGAPNYDVLVERAPDVFVMALLNLDHAPALARAKALKIASVPYFADFEPTPLGRAEWVKMFGLLTGREAEANRYFDGVAARYEGVRAQAAKALPTPAIWAFSAGGDRFTAVARPPEGAFIADAGGVNLLARPDITTKGPEDELSTEAIITRGARAKCWVAGDIHASKPPPARVLGAVDASRTGCLFANTGRSKPQVNGYDWYDGGPSQPDVILSDFVAMLHPELAPRHNFAFLRRIDAIRAGEVGQ